MLEKLKNAEKRFIQIEEALALPETVRVTAMLPLGYPTDDAAPAAFHTAFRELSDTVKTL